MPAKMRRKLAQGRRSDKKCLIRGQRPLVPRSNRVKRSVGTGIIDPIDMCAPKTTMLVAAKKMFVAAEPIEKDVFAIFPTRLFYFPHLRDLRASVNQSLLDLRPGESKISVPRKSPDNPARTSHPENVFRKMLPAGRLVNRRVSENLQALR